MVIFHSYVKLPEGNPSQSSIVHGWNQREKPLSETPLKFIANAHRDCEAEKPPFNPHVFPHVFLRKRWKTDDLYGQLTSTAAFFAQAPGSASPPAHALWPASKTCWEQPKSGDFTVQKWWIHGGLISKHCDVARSHLQLWWLNVKNCVLTSQKCCFTRKKACLTSKNLTWNINI